MYAIACVRSVYLGNADIRGVLKIASWSYLYNCLTSFKMAEVV